jgi:hypothetical protein
MRRLPCAILLPIAIVILAGALPACLATQEPPQPAPPAQAPPPDAQPAGEKPQSRKYSHADDFLIIGTVFTDKGFAFPGVELRVRRASEKKFRWDSYTNSRGEFALRVPQGTDYEMIVHVKGFLDQSKTLDAKSGLDEARLVFRMEPGKDVKK